MPQDDALIPVEADGAPPVPDHLAEFWAESVETKGSQRCRLGLRWRLSGLSWASAGAKVGLSHQALINLAHRTGLMEKLTQTASLLDLKRFKVFEADMEMLRRLRDPETLEEMPTGLLNALSGTDTDKLLVSQRQGLSTSDALHSTFDRLADLLAQGGKVTVTLEGGPETLDVTGEE